MNILLALVKPSLEEDGNTADNPDEILFDELWTDKQAIDGHLR